MVQFNTLACNVTGSGLVRFVWAMRIVAGFWRMTMANADYGDVSSLDGSAGWLVAD